MKKIIILSFGIFSSIFTQASEIRELAGICTSKETGLSVSMYPHSDIITSGLVDFVVKYQLLSSESNYIINDVQAKLDPNTNDVSFLFTNGNITFDIIVDKNNTAHLLMDEKGTRLSLDCKSAE